MSYETNEDFVRVCDAAYNRGRKDMLILVTQVPESVIPEIHRLRLVEWLNQNGKLPFPISIEVSNDTNHLLR
jgi:hypothetical protein